MILNYIVYKVCSFIDHTVCNIIYEPFMAYFNKKTRIIKRFDPEQLTGFLTLICLLILKYEHRFYETIQFG